MADRFDLFRISMLPRAQIDAFEVPGETRESQLRDVFGKRWEFGHYGHRLYYEPHLEQSPGDTIFGMLGRSTPIEEYTSPAEGLIEATHPGFLACVIAIDPREHEDGQKISIQVKRPVGGPVALVKALVGAINKETAHRTFLMDAQPIFDGRTFWDFAEANKGNITSLTFDLVAPNGLWSTASEIKDELRKLREDTRTEQVSTTMKSQEGIETNAEQIKEAVQYAEGGSGRIRAHTRTGGVFSSTDKPKSVIIDESHPPNEPLIVRAAKLVHRIFGRD